MQLRNCDSEEPELLLHDRNLVCWRLFFPAQVYIRIILHCDSGRNRTGSCKSTLSIHTRGESHNRVNNYYMSYLQQFLLYMAYIANNINPWILFLYPYSFWPSAFFLLFLSHQCLIVNLSRSPVYWLPYLPVSHSGLTVNSLASTFVIP